MCLCKVRMAATLKRVWAVFVVSPWKSWQWIVHVSLAKVGLLTFFRVIAGM